MAEHVVVIGASVAGIRTLAALRSSGFSGRITVVEAETEPPYDRPPLSKAMLLGESCETVALLDERMTSNIDGVDWRFGRRAVRLDVEACAVALDDGTSVDFDRMVIACGAVPRSWDGDDGTGGLLTLRTADDARELRRHLVQRSSVLVIGGGFIGVEVASAARRHGCQVTVVERDVEPLAAIVGRDIGRFVADVLREEGIAVATATQVAGLQRDVAGRIVSATLGDGSSVAADVVVVGVGVDPNIEWLVDSGLALGRGVLAGPDCLAVGHPHVAVVGDVAEYFSPIHGRDVNIGHWSNAVENARVAARNLLADPPDRVPNAHVPSFWSDVGTLKIRSVGLPQLADAHEIVDGSFDDGAFLVAYTASSELVGAVSVNRPRHLNDARSAVVAGSTADELKDRILRSQRAAAGRVTSATK